METDYSKFRGKCKEMSESLVEEDPSLRLVRGHYFCPIWNTEEPHWWCESEDGTVVDPTAKQFGSKGHGIYTEFDGNITCEECGEVFTEDQLVMMGTHPVCSDQCAARLVGL